MFGESEEILYMFGRQDLRYKYDNETARTLNNDTVIKNNTLVRFNNVGNITFGFGFGNNSGDRFMDIKYVDMDEGNSSRHAVVFIFGNRNYGRLLVKGEEVNQTDLYLGKDVGFFRGMYILDSNHTHILIEGHNKQMIMANLTFDYWNTTTISYRRIFQM